MKSEDVSRKNKSPGRPIKPFFTLLKLNITFYFKCYLHHNCSINLNWNNAQLYSSVKPFCNVPSSVFWFVNFCFLLFLRRSSFQKWKKIWFYYVRKWIGKKEMLVQISKYLCRNLFIRAATQIRAVCKHHKVLVTLKRCITLLFKEVWYNKKVSMKVVHYRKICKNQF